MTGRGTLWDGDAPLIAVIGVVSFLVANAMMPTAPAAAVGLLAVFGGYSIISMLNSAVEST